jgi:hypothetical protein
MPLSFAQSSPERKNVKPLFTPFIRSLEQKLEAEVERLEAALLKYSGPAAVIDLTQDIQVLLPYADDEVDTGEVCDGTLTLMCRCTLPFVWHTLKVAV